MKLLCFLSLGLLFYEAIATAKTSVSSPSTKANTALHFSNLLLCWKGLGGTGAYDDYLLFEENAAPNVNIKVIDRSSTYDFLISLKKLGSDPVILKLTKREIVGTFRHEKRRALPVFQTVDSKENVFEFSEQNKRPGAKDHSATPTRKSPLKGGEINEKTAQSFEAELYRRLEDKFAFLRSHPIFKAEDEESIGQQQKTAELFAADLEKCEAVSDLKNKKILTEMLDYLEHFRKPKLR